MHFLNPFGTTADKYHHGTYHDQLWTTTDLYSELNSWNPKEPYTSLGYLILTFLCNQINWYGFMITESSVMNKTPSSETLWYMMKNISIYYVDMKGTLNKCFTFSNNNKMWYKVYIVTTQLGFNTRRIDIFIKSIVMFKVFWHTIFLMLFKCAINDILFALSPYVLWKVTYYDHMHL